MPIIDPERKVTSKRRKDRSLLTQWSEWTWDGTKSQWQRYRLDSRGEYEYDFRSPAPEAGTSSTQSSAGMTAEGYASTAYGEPSQSQNSYQYLAPNSCQPNQSISYSPPVGEATPVVSSCQSGASFPNNEQPHQPRSQSAPTGNTQKSQKLNIGIFDYRGEVRFYLAFMDTGSDHIWVARRVVDDLLKEINYLAPQITVTVGNDDVLSSQGTATLTWKRPEGNRTHTNVFNVFESNTFDVILGRNFLQSAGILPEFNTGALLPLIEAHRESQHHQEERKRATEAQKADSAASEARRRRSEQKKSEKNNDRSKGSSSRDARR